MPHSMYSQSWYQHASVRVKHHIPLRTDSSLPFFPEELQPLCKHPFIAESKSDIKTNLLTQTCYKYLQEVCITENDVVNPTCLNIAFGKAPVQLSEEIKADAFSIITDEAFHSYVAKILLLQIQTHTGLVPLLLPQENEVTKALKKMRGTLPAEMLTDFELVATCISENVFTDEIIEISRFKNVNESFHQVMVDHARDEGRHARYFMKIMETYWDQADEKKKLVFSKVIPQFIEYCLDGVHDADFLVRLLQACQLEKHKIDTLIAANSSEITQQSRQARLNNMVKFLKASNVLTYEPLAESIHNLGAKSE